MPQMSPMAWGPLYFFFLASLVIYFSWVYYTPRVMSKNFLMSKKSLAGLNWRW